MGVEGRPSKVSTAVTLLWIIFGIGVIRGILEYSKFFQTVSSTDLGVGSAIFTSIISLVILAFLIFMIGRGRNWARIVYLVFFILGIFFVVIPLFTSLASNLISGILGIVQVVLQITALVFLFQKQSSDWFKSK